MELKLTNVLDIEDFDTIALEHWNSFKNNPPVFDKDILKNFNVVQALKDNKTIGYIIYLCFKSLYYENIWCQIDMFYLKPEFRGKGIGKEMFNLVEQEAKKQGASRIISSFNLQQPLEQFYKNLGYTQTHVAVAKEI